MIEGRGEEEAIALALDLRATCARRQAGAELRPAGGLQLTDTLGVLLKLHRPGLATRGLEEDLRLLEEVDMRVQVRVLGGSLS